MYSNKFSIAEIRSNEVSQGLFTATHDPFRKSMNDYHSHPDDMMTIHPSLKSGKTLLGIYLRLDFLILSVKSASMAGKLTVK